MINVSKTIRRAIETAQSPAVLCSWGKDSGLLLHYARQVKPDIAVYYLGNDLPAPAIKAVARGDLAVYSFASSSTYYIARNYDLHRVDEYDFNGNLVPMLSPVQTSAGKCEACRLEYGIRLPAFYFPHDVALWGYRHADSHPLLPDVTFEREIQLGHTKFVAPLYDLTTDQVLNALDVLGLEYADDEPVQICEDCMNALIANATLAGFQERPLNH